MIEYRESVIGIMPDQLTGFFVGWPNPPDPATHLRILEHSDLVVIAVDTSLDRVVGFVTAITDHVLAAFIPHLEVLPEWQGQGIGTELVQRILARLDPLYAIDLMCDDDVVPFYVRLGFQRSGGMVIRRYQNQSGAAEPVQG